MHRRARHLNARHAGAGLVLDARRISGLNDGDAVSTWSDSSGSGRDATNTLTARPTYKTAIQGGQPSVLFDGSNDFLRFSSQLLFNAPATCVAVYKRTATNVNMAPLCGPSGASAYPILEFQTDIAFIQGNNYYASKLTIGVAWRVASSSASSAPSFVLRFNGSGQSMGSLIAFTTSGMTYVGRETSRYSNGYISSIVFIGLSVGDALKKRLEHSAAFSFKIQCS